MLNARKFVAAFFIAALLGIIVPKYSSADEHPIPDWRYTKPVRQVLS